VFRSPEGRRAQHVETRIVIIVRFDHIVLFFSAHTVLWTECGDEAEIGTIRQHVETGTTFIGDRGGVAEKGETTAGERSSALNVSQEFIDSQDHFELGDSL
jgi:hypothetical protein